MLFNIAIIIIILIIILVVLFQYKNIENFTDSQKSNDPLSVATPTPTPTTTPTTTPTPTPTTTPTPTATPTPTTTPTTTPIPTATPTTTPTTPTIIPVIPTDFISIISKNVPWGMYSSDKYDPLKPTVLPDIFNRPDKSISISGNLISRMSDSGHGYTKIVKELAGTVDTSLNWSSKLPQNYTICSITRYTNTLSNQGNILTTSSTLPNSNIWVHGHYLKKKGIVAYGNYLTDSNLNIGGNIDDWVITCAKNIGTASSNVIVNGNAIGSNISSMSNVDIMLTINNNTTIAKSDFALNYIIIWDTLLSDNDLNTITKSFINYLNNPILLYDKRILSTIISNYNNNNKSCLVNQLDPNSNIYFPQLITSNITSNISNLASNISNLKSESSQPTAVLLNSINEKLNYLMQTDLLMANTLIRNNNIKAPSTTSVASGALQDLLSKLTSLENKFNSGNIKADNIINLDKNNQSIISPICLKSDKMPQPLAQSFISDFSNFNSLNTDDYAQSKVWCECNSNNKKTNDCVAYNACRANYIYNKDNTYNTISTIDKEIYNDCVNAFSAFPKYLDNK